MQLPLTKSSRIASCVSMKGVVSRKFCKTSSLDTDQFYDLFEDSRNIDVAALQKLFGRHMACLSIPNNFQWDVRHYKIDTVS